jgi:hypothetical protein
LLNNNGQAASFGLITMEDIRFCDWMQTVALEKKAKLKGSASVDLEVLQFQRSQDANNVDRLGHLFHDIGCDKLDARNHVPAIIDQQTLDSAIRHSGLTADMLMDNSRDTYVELSFPVGFQLHCLHGGDRVKAAKELLPIGDKRWIVDLYLSGSVSFLFTMLCKIPERSHRHER